MQKEKEYILVTSGEPGGVGPELCLELANHVFNEATIVVLGDIDLLKQRASLLKKNICFIEFANLSNLDFTELSCAEIESLFCSKNNLNNKTGELLVLHVPCENKNTVGKLLPENAHYVVKMLDTAIMLCKYKFTHKIVTLPISKEVINKSQVTVGHFFGHTEYFAEAFGCKKVVMMLATSKMRVALLTTHIPLSEVAKQVTLENILETVYIIHNSLQKQYNICNPRIAVCGLNPHAGEGGYIGHEEVDVINPAIHLLQQNGLDVSGAYSADTIFNRVNEFDVILAMYHDQGLPVLKYSGFEEGINITLGLPITRISVDHGTALNIAGKGIASSQSLLNAVLLAVSL